MWINVEGSTCSGKSTLISELEKLMPGATMFHQSKPERLDRRWVLNAYANGMLDLTGDVLADRWHWGEMTYSPIYRPDTNRDGYGLLGKAGWRWVELFLMSRGAVTMLLRADPDVLVRRFNKRGDDHVQGTDELLQVAKLYDEAYLQAPSCGHVWDTSIATPRAAAGVAAMLVKAAEQMDAKVEPLREFPHYIGTPTPTALLVGDTRNVTKRYGEETVLPFMPVDGNSGDYLLRALPDDWWPRVGLVNANEDEASLVPLWHALGRPPVVALGQEAKRALSTTRVPHAAVPHPQYVRRFQHETINEYGRLIQDAARGQE